MAAYAVFAARFLDFFAAPFVDRFAARFFAGRFVDFTARFVAVFVVFFVVFFAVFLADFFGGTLAPSRRASDKPIAIACLRLLTFLPVLPLRSVPALRSCI